jgi:hypothetical protein
MRETASTVEGEILSPFQIQAGALTSLIIGSKPTNGSHIFHSNYENPLVRAGPGFNIYPSDVMNGYTVPEQVNGRHFGLHNNLVDFDYNEDAEELNALSQLLKLGKE